MFGQSPLLEPCDGVVVVPVPGVVVDPEFVVVPELELAALAIAAPPPAMIPTVPRVTRAIRSRFMAFTSFRRFGLRQAKTSRLRRACAGPKSFPRLSRASRDRGRARF